MKGFNAVVRMVTVGVLMGLAGSVAAQQAYPNKPIRFITPYVPGGSTDITARFIADSLRPLLGQPVTVDNRPGGNGFIGGDALAKSTPDGYTLMVMASTHHPLICAQPVMPGFTLWRSI